MSALFLKDLAQKTRRGQIGRVKAGRIPGGKSYGYDVVNDGDDRGRRTINPAEADIVQRIFREYAIGKGPLAIVRDLNREAVPGPAARHWNASALLGPPKRRNGILNNELYIGQIVYNRQRFLKDPTTGKRISRENPEKDWHRQSAPELRIIDDRTGRLCRAVAPSAVGRIFTTSDAQNGPFLGSSTAAPAAPSSLSPRMTICDARRAPTVERVRPLARC